MKETILALRGDGPSDTERLVLAPAVGIYLDPPPVGTYLTAGSSAGALRVLNTTYGLIVPRGTAGLIREQRVADRMTRVEYGQPLLQLSTALAGGAIDELAGGEGGAEEAEDSVEVPAGMLALRAPTDGIFYRRPSPEESPYVEPEQVVERGKVLGLIEVMKCFNQVTYDLPGGAPAKARIHRIVAGDGAEVSRGQILFVIAPE
jgi:acetyl-CoA carboxylase biotin carboxyl carrier protein